MVMPNKVTQAPAAAGPETEEGRRPTIVPGPAAASPELSDRPRYYYLSATENLLGTTLTPVQGWQAVA